MNFNNSSIRKSWVRGILCLVLFPPSLTLADSTSYYSSVEGHSINACDPEPADCSIAIIKLLKENKKRPIKIEIGSGGNKRYVFNKTVALESGVSISGVGMPIFIQKSKALFSIKPPDTSVDINVNGFVVNQQQNSSAKNILHIKPEAKIKNISIANIRIENTNPRVRANIPFLIDRVYGENLTISKISVEGLSSFVQIKNSKLSNINIINNKVKSIGRRGISLTCECVDIVIANNEFIHNVPGIAASNMLFTNIRAAHELNGMKEPVKNLKIQNNTFAGIPGISFVRGVVNGASADLVTVHYVHNFTIEGNLIQDSGEAGITISDGSYRGLVKRNTILNTDTVPIVLGAAGKQNGIYAKVEDIQVKHNIIDNYAIFHQQIDSNGEYDDWGGKQLHARSAVRVLNASRICLLGNTIKNHDSKNRKFYGIWVLDGTLANSVENSDVYHGNNNFMGFAENINHLVRANRPNAIPIPVVYDGGATRITTNYYLIGKSLKINNNFVCNDED